MTTRNSKLLRTQIADIKLDVVRGMVDIQHGNLRHFHTRLTVEEAEELHSWLTDYITEYSDLGSDPAEVQA